MSVLGQSFGGFCTVSYLSFAPEGLREAFITGGLPGLTTTADDVCRRTYPLAAAKNAEHYARYPMDVDRARRIAAHLTRQPAELPDGFHLTAQAFQLLGNLLGRSIGSDTLHYLLEDAFDGDHLTDSFRYQLQGLLSFSQAPLYTLLHEACYAQGTATRWSAQRIRSEFAEFDVEPAVEGSGPLLFTGEMIYPWITEADPVLRPVKEAADILAERDGWPPLYRPGPAGSERGPGGRGHVLQRHVRPADRAVHADRGGYQGPAPVGHQQVARAPNGVRVSFGQGPRPPDQDGQGRSLGAGERGPAAQFSIPGPPTEGTITWNTYGLGRPG